MWMEFSLNRTFVLKVSCRINGVSSKRNSFVKNECKWFNGGFIKWRSEVSKMFIGWSRSSFLLHIQYTVQEASDEKKKNICRRYNPIFRVSHGSHGRKRKQGEKVEIMEKSGNLVLRHEKFVVKVGEFLFLEKMTVNMYRVCVPIRVK